MAQYQGRRIPTRQGDIVAYLSQPWWGGEHPLVIMLHGALRSAAVLGGWGERLAGVADVALIDLPGHGNSAAPKQASVAGMTPILAEAISTAFQGRRALLVGESLGGTIGLAIGGLEDPGPVRAIFAADPPITTTKLWSVHSNFRKVMGQGPGETFVDQLGRDTFGMNADGLTEIVYYPLIGALKLPAVIATGDVPLQPPRPLSKATSLFDGVDQFVAGELYPGKVKIERIPDCGHLLLLEVPDVCLAIILQMLAEHLDEPSLA